MMTYVDDDYNDDNSGYDDDNNNNNKTITIMPTAITKSKATTIIKK